MSARVSLPSWPSALDCLSWSSDCMIAAASGERISILIPRFERQSKDDAVWQTVHFAANEYTQEQVPQRPPLSFRNFSLGEELTHRQIVSLQWSHPGLGRYSRCALAALDTSHILSIWACDGRLTQPSKWRRKLVLNPVIFDFYKQNNTAFTERHHSRPEQQIVYQRISCFAWAEPPVKDSSTSQGNAHIMAVATGANDILFLSIVSHGNVLNGFATNWDAKVVGFISGSDMSLKLDIVPAHPSMIEHIALGDWCNFDGTDKVCLGACIINQELLAFESRCNVLDDGKLQMRVEKQVTCTGGRPKKGPLRVLPTECWALVMIEQDSICLITPDFKSLSYHERILHDLDGRWDEVSGMAFTRESVDDVRVHITSHLTSANASTTWVNTSSVPATSVPPWQQALVEAKSAFRSTKQFAHGVLDKTWGIAASPLGDFIAVCVTYVSSNGLNYIIPGEQRGIVSITPDLEAFNGSTCSKTTLWPQPSAEAQLLHIQTLHEQSGKMFGDGLELDSQSKVVDSLVPTYTRTRTSLDVSPTHLSSDMSSQAQVQYLRESYFYTRAAAKRRCLYLIHLAKGDKTERKRLEIDITQDQATLVSELARALDVWSELSLVIIRNYQKLASLLGQGTFEHELGSNEAGSVGETCEFCGQAIPFESIKWARCNNGHQFGRCFVTLLVIQAPGLTKSCGICKARYIDPEEAPQFGKPISEEVPLDGDKEIEPQHIREGSQHRANGLGNAEQLRKVRIEPLGSFARVLLAAFDSCVLCGGKFVS